METLLEKHGKLALKTRNYTLNAGRYTFQKKSESKIYIDVIQKLDLKKKDICLDVGCGVGAILLPLSKKVKHITGIDSKNSIKILKKRLKFKNVKLIDGDFINCKLKKKFDKIIIYSVLHVFSSKRDFYIFINKALKLLKPGGKLLIGDLPNETLKKKFLKSKSGKIFLKKWKMNKITRQDHEAHKFLSYNSVKRLKIDDQFIIDFIKYLRLKGFSSYIFPQKKELPFGYTREDILIESLK